MLWVTRTNVRVGRIACIWLIRRFIDPAAEIRYLPQEQVVDLIAREAAIPFHVRGVEFNHRAQQTPFELMLEKYELTGDPALELLGRIVNGADTDNSRYQQPEGPGIRAVTEGIRKLGLGSDEAIVTRGADVFDALYAYCRERTR